MKTKILIRKMHSGIFRIWNTAYRFLNDIRYKQALDWPGGTVYLNCWSKKDFYTRSKSCSKEPKTVEWLTQNLTNSSAVFFDVGANVGAYSLIAAKLGARVFAFEPTHMNYFALVENILLNSVNNQVCPIPLGLSQSSKVDTLHLLSNETGSALAFVGGGAQTKIGEILNQPGLEVLTLAIDDLTHALGLPKPNFLKIDVDGAELSVIKGGLRTLSDVSVKSVLIEVDLELISKRQINELLNETGLFLDSEEILDNHTVNLIFSRR